LSATATDSRSHLHHASAPGLRCPAKSEKMVWRLAKRFAAKDACSKALAPHPQGVQHLVEGYGGVQPARGPSDHELTFGALSSDLHALTPKGSSAE